MFEGGGGPVEPAFISDLMLGKLCRWLRMAGFDVLFPYDLDDDGLIELSRKTDRVLLTRDKDLSDRKKVRTLRIRSVDVDGQLEELTLAFPDILGRSRTSRCPGCNTMLAMVDRGSLMDAPNKLVPEKVLRYHRTFFVCQSCGKTYWKGTHWVQIENRLRSHGLIIDDSRVEGTEK